MMPILFITFVVFVVSIELLLWCYERYIKRAHIRINASDKLAELEFTIDGLYAKETLFEAYKSGAYKGVLEAEIRTLYHKASSTINLLNLKRVLHHMSNIFLETLLPPNPTGGHVESKLMRRIREKKIAMGHKADDHEEYQGPSMPM